ncbi:MAG TPA: T9SS type A sorting domain-containing protein [Candidatus Marinimicrobia bacterium]|nr:T9SS type A sorting domain-containing protein [Candidatus Neomarinimicrobiota bacterium]
MKKHIIQLLIITFLGLQILSASPKEEFRAVWVATVSRLDWPSSSVASSQQSQMISILNSLKNYKFNAMIFQVRPACDAFYASEIEPWSNWLTGTEGQAPSPFYDPLEYAIEEAHARGIEVHAWLNPYRAKTGNAGTSPNHVFNKHPEWILTVGSKDGDTGIRSLDERELPAAKAPTYILDPGKAAVREYVLSVIVDIATRYDIDGIHMDDYFYPYSGMGNEDAETFTEESRGFTNIGDWRRDNVNLLIKGIHDTLQAINPRIKFGMSPFGIWKNGTPPGIVGLDAYNVIYCDAVKWLNEQWIDYITPQLYWPFGGGQDYGKLMPWWAGIAANNDRHLYVGQAAYRITNWTADEMPRQVRLNRSTEASLGSVFFRYANTPGGNPLGFRDSLRTNYYKFSAVPPTMTWKDSLPSPAPKNFQINFDGDNAILTWEHGDMTAAHDDSAARYLVYKWPVNEVLDRNDGTKILALLLKNQELTVTDADFSYYQYGVTSLDRLSNESELIQTTTTSAECFSVLPSEWCLHPAWPNPFNPAVQISYTIPRASDIHLAVYDITGRQIHQMITNHTQAGTYSHEWNASAHPSGLYIVTISGPGFRSAQKISHLK